MAFKENGYTEFFEKDGKPWKRTWEHCWKCSGRGVIPYYMHVANGVCFKCEDHKGYWVERRVLNEKEQARRDAAKVRKAAKREQERADRQMEFNKLAIEKLGFGNGSIHVVALHDTFSLKDELKEAGARFKGEFGWFFTQPTDLYPTIEITAEEGLEFHDFSSPNVNPEVKDMIKQKIDAINPRKVLEWIGQVGDKIEVKVTFKRDHSFDTQFGTKWIYIFSDENENIVKWSTGKALFLDEGQQILLKGTIKELSEFRDEKQTEMTRCKILDRE